MLRNTKLPRMLAAFLVMAVFAISCDSLKPDKDPEETAEVFDISKSLDNGFIVMSLDLDNNGLEMIIPKEEVPHIGDIIASGITDYAPDGFLYVVDDVKVETITDTKVTVDEIRNFLGDAWDDLKDTWSEMDWKDYVKAQISCSGILLHDALKKLGLLDKNGWFVLKEKKATLISDDGTEVLPVSNGESKALFTKDFKIPDKYLTGKNPSFTITPTFGCSITEFNYYLDDAVDGDGIKYGIDTKIKFNVNIHLAAEDTLKAIKGDILEKYSLGDPKLRWKYQFSIGPLPVVITTELKCSIPYELQLAAKADFDLLNYNCYINVAAIGDTYYNSIVPIKGRTKIIKLEPFEYDDEPGKTSITLDGKGSIGLDVGFSVGLYGSNYIDLVKDDKKFMTMAFNFGVNFEAGYECGVGYNELSLSQHPFRFKDSVNAAAYIYGKASYVTIPKLDWTDLDEEFLLNWEKEYDFFKSSYSGSLLFPSYVDLKLKAIDENEGIINIKAKQVDPIIGGPSAIGRGFCLEKKLDPNVEYYYVDDGSATKSGWNSVFNPQKDEDYELDVDFNLPIPISKLERNVKYSVYPFTRVKETDLLGLDNYFIYGDGVDFIVDENGKISVSYIDEVPGKLL